MSRTRIVGGKITEIVGGDYKIYSAENIEINSQKHISINGNENGVTYGNPKKPPTLDKMTTECVVEFRTKQDGTYTGQFGFDWLRLDDSGLTTEAKYEDCIENGYEAPNGKAPRRDANTEYESKDEAFKALKKEYPKIKVDIVPKPAVAPFTKDYFVPYLALFPKPYSDAAVVPTGMPKPPFEAELRTLVEVGGTDAPDQIRIVFDKRYFEINGKDGSDTNPVLISDKAIGVKREATADSIKVKCIEGFTTQQEIKVYVYPKGTLAKPVAEQLFARKLAGKIIVLPNKNTTGQNAVKNIKELKLVLVRVKTNILSLPRPNIGNYNFGSASTKTTDLINGLYQTLIKTNVISQRSIGTVASDIILDVTGDARFKQQYDASGNILGSTFVKTNNELTDNGSLIPTLRTLLNTNTGNTYRDYFMAFSFDENCDGLNGFAEDIGKKAVALFKPRNSKTLPHEAMHGLGLYHTHRDFNHVYINSTDPNTATIFSKTRSAPTNNNSLKNNKDNLYVGTDNSTWNYDVPSSRYVLSSNYFNYNHPKNQKLVFKHAWYDSAHGTDNIMSYNGALRKTTWKWQWEQLKKHL
ncbi:hypothetical protein V3Q90_15640 [Flavobacterium oreochromis]|uniref:hypothetical protein n=1 Tax=Flavobacterium oreochromis TaxID=2906078 RepID=UPI00385D5343